MLEKLKHFKLTRHFLQEASLVATLVSMGVIVFASEYRDSQQLLSFKQAQAEALSVQVDQLLREKETLVLDNNRLMEAYEKVATDTAVLANEAWQSGLKLYKDINGKYLDYEDKGVELKEYEDDLDSVLEMLLGEEYEQLSEKVNELDSKFDSAKQNFDIAQQKLVQERAAVQQTASAPVVSNPGAGYSRITVATEVGSFVVSLLKVDLSGVEVVTVTGNDANCDNDCVVKPLGTYVTENLGFAGINGTYFCPPDYGSCAGKVNSYDFPVYSSQHNKWINDDKLFWNGRAMMAFSRGSAWFCADAKSCNVGVTAGITNYPALINNGNIVVEPGFLSDSLKNVRGFRGAIGLSGNILYLMVVRGATVLDVAYVMKALSIQNGLNLDGGGSSAMYINGSYAAGPGRALPNAVVLRYK
jgi:ElaB/YqjD/DUF883 family membrane-anchored ribosome-binding protein